MTQSDSLPTDLRVGSRVVDRWWRHWGTGKVLSRTASRARIKFPEHREPMTYDRAHFQFLELVR